MVSRRNATIIAMLFLTAYAKQPRCNAASMPTTPAPLTHWTQYLTGTWSCKSGITPYTAVYRPALGGRWIRAINTSGASQSEDMLTYDNRSKMWTLFDMEPGGASAAMHGESSGSRIHLSDPSSHARLAIHRITGAEYHLEFLAQNGNGIASIDVCKRRNHP